MACLVDSTRKQTNILYYRIMLNIQTHTSRQIPIFKLSADYDKYLFT